MMSVKEQALIPMEKHSGVIEARERSTSARRELDAARAEAQEALDIIWPPPNSTELITIEREDWALARLAKRRPDAIHRAGHTTQRVLIAERAVAETGAAQIQIETAVKAELRAIAYEKTKALLPELERMIEQGVELTRELEALGRDAGLSDDHLTLAPFTNVCGTSLAKNALAELRRKIQA